MRVGVGKRAETVVIFLAGGIPEGELDVLAVHLDIGDVVLENGGDIDLLRAMMSVGDGRCVHAQCCCDGSAGRLG
jgi:hypothetical protein